MSTNTQPLRAGGYQSLISSAFLVAATLMVSQYTYYHYGPAHVIVAPLGWSHADDIAVHPTKPKPAPKEDGDAAKPAADGKAPGGYEEPGEKDAESVQRRGVFVLDWPTFDKVAYKLRVVKSLAPAEILVALLFLLAAPLALLLGGRQLWPRWPQWLFIGLAALSMLGADAFKEGRMQLLQWGLAVLATWWLAGVALVTPGQCKRFGRLLTVLTVFLIAFAGLQYLQAVLFKAAGQQMPTYVRASCQSRSAYGGLLAMLLSFAFAQVLEGENKGRGKFVRLGWVLLCAAGMATMMAGGAVVAFFVAMVAMAALRNPRTMIFTLVLAPMVYFGTVDLLPDGHLRLVRGSWAFLAHEDGPAVSGVEKRWLEAGAALTGFSGLRDDDVLGQRKDETGDVITVPIAKRPVAAFGVGPGANYQQTIGEWYGSLDNPKKQEPDTYTLYLMLAVQLGLCGVLAWAWLLADGAATARGAYQALADRELRTLALGVFGACVSVLVFSVWGTILLRGTGLMLFTLLALGARLASLPAAAPLTEVVGDDANL